MRKLLACLGILGCLPAAIHAYAALPDNPIAFRNCTAKVKVDAARLRAAPSLDAKILGVKTQDSPLYVTKVCGKWVQVVLASGDTAYIAAYLLSFPASEILEQWKKDNPSPTVGKKAKVKWADAALRKYPSLRAPRMGHFDRNDEVAVLTDLGNGWSLVQSRKADASGDCFGFVRNRALVAPDVPDPPEWSAPLAQVRVNRGDHIEKDPVIESPAQYCARTAWTPELFALEMNAKLPRHRGPAEPAELVAVR